MIAETPDNKYILCGITNSSDSYDVRDTNNGGFDILVMQTDCNGNVEWTNCIGGTGTDYGTVFDFTVDANGIL
jgi:hypothetical protein